MEKLELLHCRWKCKMSLPLWKTAWSKTWKENYMIQQSQFWVYNQRTQSDTCISIFTEALFTIARPWRQPKCPLTDEWIRKMWYIHTMDYCSALQKKGISLHVKPCVKLEDVKQNKPITEGQILHDFIYVICLN